MKAWYFSDDKCKLRYGDGRKIRPGVTHTVDCKPILCEQGLHGSKRILDALEYAPGNYVWRVELSGDVVCGDDKMAATCRKYLWGYDAESILRKFARLCALDVLHLWEAPDIVVQYLKTGDERIRAAARAAAWAAAGAAARDAAGAAARDAAGAAARAAARGAARDAARYAARYAARGAARDKHEERLYRMVMRGRPQAAGA